jgi:hypothetical protein
MTSNPKKPYKKAFFVGKLNPFPPEEPLEPEPLFAEHDRELFY